LQKAKEFFADSFEYKQSLNIKAKLILHLLDAAPYSDFESLLKTTMTNNSVYFKGRETRIRLELKQYLHELVKNDEISGQQALLLLDKMLTEDIVVNKIKNEVRSWVDLNKNKL